MDKERIERLGHLAFYGYSQYVQEVEKSKKTESGNRVETTDVVQMLDTFPEYVGNRINIFV
jgi:hypothetical protein